MKIANKLTYSGRWAKNSLGNAPSPEFEKRGKGKKCGEKIKRGKRRGKRRKTFCDTLSIKSPYF